MSSKGDLLFAESYLAVNLSNFVTCNRILRSTSLVIKHLVLVYRLQARSECHTSTSDLPWLKAALNFHLKLKLMQRYISC